MTYREYKFLRKLHKMDKEMNDEQKYQTHFVSEVSKQTGLSDSEVLAMAKMLSQEDYIELVNNKPEYGGYIHCMRITYIGVSALNYYYTQIINTFIWSILVPAIVSIACSCIVVMLTT